MHKPVFEHIISQHAEEAAFLWLLRNRAVYAPHYRVTDLSALDNRIESHLDGIRNAGDAGWEICERCFTDIEAGEIFTCSVLAFEGKDNRRVQTIMDKGVASTGLSRGIVSAFGWLPFAQAEKYIKSFLISGKPELRRIGISAYAIHRQDPGKALAYALTDKDLLLRMQALKAVGQLGKKDMLQVLEDNLGSDYEECRFWAAWSATLLGNVNAVGVLKTIAMSESPYAEEAMKMALRRMNLPDVHEWHKDIVNKRSFLRPAITCAGTSGDPSFITWLTNVMEMPESARLAGEAFTMITGIDIASGIFNGTKPEGFEPGPKENPEDEDVVLDPDMDLPWPDCKSIAAWWSEHRGLFQCGVRYLSGRPITPEWLKEVLRYGRQRERAAAAVELAILNTGKPVFEVRARGFLQEQILSGEDTIKM